MWSSLTMLVVSANIFWNDLAVNVASANREPAVIGEKG